MTCQHPYCDATAKTAVTNHNGAGVVWNATTTEV